MKNVFSEVNTLDQKCYNRFGLSEDLLMEHAALAIKQEIEKRFDKGCSVLIATGPGNNGADGIALARMLQGDYEVRFFPVSEPKSPMALLQMERAYKIGLSPLNYLTDSDVIVDCLFGSGLNKPLDKKLSTSIKKLNAKNGFKIACDIPSGLDQQGRIQTEAFKADLTVTMGALKTSLYSDDAKDYTGEIIIADLGISHTLYEEESPIKLLERSDLSLPFRTQENTHKGSYGHLSVICGNKPGAAIIAGNSALRFGAGLVTLVTDQNITIPYELMQNDSLPENTTALCLGMGLGYDYDLPLLQEWTQKFPCIVDADLLCYPEINLILDTPNPLVLTPHPKEFVSLLKFTGLGEISVQELQHNRFEYFQAFSEKFPQHTLLLKGANTLISSGETIYINPLGSNALAKGGSGDVLGGLIGALLAQGFSPNESAIQGSIAHALAAQNVGKNNYALTPSDLIESICHL